MKRSEVKTEEDFQTYLRELDRNRWKLLIAAWILVLGGIAIAVLVW